MQLGEVRALGPMTHESRSPSMAADPVARDDLLFLVDLARRMQWDAQLNHAGAGPGIEPQADFLQAHIATGTLAALMWVLGVCTVAPASGRIIAQRSAGDLTDEVAVAQQWREQELRDGVRWLQLGGILDALDFARGLREPFWWVPLPEAMRAGPVARDRYGRST